MLITLVQQVVNMLLRGQGASEDNSKKNRLLYSQTHLMSHLWDCQNCVILKGVDINRVCLCVYMCTCSYAVNETTAGINILRTQNYLLKKLQVLSTAVKTTVMLPY